MSSSQGMISWNMYSSANKIFAVLRRNHSDPLSRAMGCIGELRTSSRSAGYERFGTGNIAPLVVLVPIPKPPTHSKGASNQHPHCTVYISMYHVGSHWIAVRYVQGNKWILKLHCHNFSPCDWSDALKRRNSYMLSLYKQTAIHTHIYIYIYLYRGSVFR